VSALCILAAGATITIAAQSFTLGWTHSIERIPIVESWTVEGDRLHLTESRIKGSGAGIEPGEDARREDGWYVWNPVADFRQRITLRRSGFEGTGDWTLCVGDVCRMLGTIVPEEADPVILEPC
jgi:hypothetical protein